MLTNARARAHGFSIPVRALLSWPSWPTQREPQVRSASQAFGRGVFGALVYSGNAFIKSPRDSRIVRLKPPKKRDKSSASNINNWLHRHEKVLFCSGLNSSNPSFLRPSTFRHTPTRIQKPPSSNTSARPEGIPRPDPPCQPNLKPENLTECQTGSTRIELGSSSYSESGSRSHRPRRILASHRHILQWQPSSPPPWPER